MDKVGSEQESRLLSSADETSTWELPAGTYSFQVTKSSLRECHRWRVHESWRKSSSRELPVKAVGIPHFAKN